jgi:Spy/CpxP family protein refolding chaperone
MRTALIAVVLGWLLFPGLGLAQPLQPTAPLAPGGGLRTKIAKRIQQWRMMRIIQAINLSTAQAPKFFATVNKFEKQLKKHRQQNHKIMKHLRQMVASGQYQAAKINRLVSQLMNNQVSIKQVELKRFQAVRKILKPKQLAKLVILMPRLERQIRRMIHRAQGRRRPVPWKNTSP